MTIVVSIKVTDGVVLASDSATTFFDKTGTAVKVYNNANKVFNLLKGSPIGAMTYGSGSIGTASIATLSKDFRVMLGDPESDFHIDREKYTIKEVAEKASQFMAGRFHEAYPDGIENYYMGFRVFGYSSGGSLPEGFEFGVTSDGLTEMTELYPSESFGPRWAGDMEAIDRLIFGYSTRLFDVLVANGVPQENVPHIQALLNDSLPRSLCLPAMPIQDAIELAKFLVDVAAKFAHFSLQAATIGGPIEVATITKHEGFRWVSRKHYFSVDFNPGTYGPSA